MQTDDAQSPAHLSPYLSRMGAWAFSLGTAIGWGSLVVTSNSYLLQAGPVGSVIGLVLGAVAMLVVARNYHYLINRFPSAGGAYTYAKEILGHDYGFLTAWFLALVYLAILWANATSLPLFARYFVGDAFEVGLCFTVFGYDVYLGEALLSIGAVLVVALACARSRKLVMRAMVGMAVVLCACIVACFAVVVLAPGAAPGAHLAAGPAFLPDKGALEQVVRIACISSWAFIGFENVSHFAPEYAFARTRAFRVMAAAIGVATVLYACVMLLSVSAFPPAYANWHEYLLDLPNLQGIEGMPAFYAASRHLGDTGVRLLMLALLCLVLTSLVGNMVALSRLFFALAQDDILPARYARLNGNGIPARAVLLVALLSVPVPFLGRTAIGWIVDVTTIGATTIYGLVSAFARRMGIARGDRTARATGTVGVALMVACGLYLVLPSLLFLSNDLAYESYFIFAVWGILGFVLFRWLLARDTRRRFGRSVVVWMGLLSIVMFVSFVWTNQAVMEAVDNTMERIVARSVADEGGLVAGGVADEGDPAADGGGTDENGPDAGASGEQAQAYVDFAARQRDRMNRAVLQSMLAGLGILALASVLLLSNFSYLSDWAQESERELDLTRDILDTDPLTGLPTAARFHGLATTAAEALWDAGERPVAVAFDLMGMKDFNAKNGRTEGDRLLRAFADVLRERFGDEGCARSAEDSFYALVSLTAAQDRMQGVFDDFARSNDGMVLPVRAGAYACEPADELFAVGFDRARTARDLDRSTWQSHVTWFSEGMGDEAQSRLHVLEHLDQAIAERWIRPYYQAVVSARTGEVCGAEALARWIDPEDGFLSPAQFIPIVETAGLMHKVDMHMIDCVVVDLASRRSQGLRVVPVSVNVSLLDLERLDVAREIVRRVDAAGLEHSLLHIEFTESVASQDPAMLHRAVDELRRAGFEVWMDDFGSGYSSLNSLKDFDFDVVKLDMEFIRGAQGAKTWDIVTGVIGVCGRIGARTLAEGVETEEQARRLREAGCDMLQGFLYARPVPLGEFEA